jgi:hypothetical protein
MHNYKTGMVWLIIISVLVFGKCSGEIIAVIMGQDKQVIVAWQVVCPVGLCCFFSWGKFFPSLLVY